MNGTFDLSNRTSAFVIAEAGTCHAMPEANDRFLKANGYVLAAKNKGADCIKFQMFDKSRLFCPYPGDEQRMPRWRDSWLHIDDWRQVKEFTEACEMVFLASVFQDSMVEMLKELKVEATKVASRAAEKFPYESAPGPFLISTGMHTPQPTSPADVYLQCEANYPSTATWAGELAGFSDHSGTPWRAIDAISRGCKLVEVHFYIDKIDAGPDLPASLNLDELKLVCEARDAFAELRNEETT